MRSLDVHPSQTTVFLSRLVLRYQILPKRHSETYKGVFSTKFRPNKTSQLLVDVWFERFCGHPTKLSSKHLICMLRINMILNAQKAFFIMDLFFNRIFKTNGSRQRRYKLMSGIKDWARDSGDESHYFCVQPTSSLKQHSAYHLLACLGNLRKWPPEGLSKEVPTYTSKS